MEEKTKEAKRFSIISRIKSTNHAWRGVGILLKTTHNLWVHLFFGLLAVYMGFTLHISNIEWVLVVFAIGLIIVAETFNTAMEIDMDLTSPEYHPYARDTKDLAAGAVLLSVMTAGIIGAIIFLPKIF